MNLSEKEKKEIESILGRKPSTVELYIFDTMWSEHCSYKSSKPVLRQLPTKGSEVVLGIGEDSGIIHFTEHKGKRYGLAISHESHNHPSQILPIEGAATGVGGVVRDVYCMGADVLGVLNSLHFGVDKEKNNPLIEEISKRVIKGVSDYANPLGVPVLGGETLYHPSYNDNCLVNVAAIGLVEEDKIIHSYVPKEAKTETYKVILLGKSTDATGFGGASFSSTTLDSEDEVANMGAVQVHDPFLKRVLVEAIKALLKEVSEKKIKIGFKDLGAGGIACAASEIATAGGFGVTLDLDEVNVALPNLGAEVIACSETQERFCLVVPEQYADRVLEIFNKEFALPDLYHEAGAAVIGTVINDLVFQLMYQGKEVCNLPVKAITTEVSAERHSIPREAKREAKPIALTTEKIQEMGYDLLKQQNNTSKRYVYRFFDNAVRGDTVIYPGEADAVVITPIEGCDVGVAASMDSNLYGDIDPYVSGAYAVAEGIRNVISVGARPLAITDCLNYGNPEKGEAFFEFEEGVRGISDAANQLGFIEGEPVPIISGNVSFYNESKQGTAVIPSPVIAVVGKCDHYKKAITMQLKVPNQKIIMIGERYPEYGGTQLANLLEIEDCPAPQVRYKEESLANKAVLECIQQGWVSACHDISMGGLYQALIEMCLGERGLSRVGIELDIKEASSLTTLLFSENGGYVIACDTEQWPAIEERLTQDGVPYQEIGETISKKELNITHHKEKIEIQLNKAKEALDTYNTIKV